MKQIIAVSQTADSWTVIRVTPAQLQEIKDYCAKTPDTIWRKADADDMYGINHALNAGRSWVPQDFIFGSGEVVR